MSETMTVSTADGQFHAYVARPGTTPAPAIVVIQEIFGINADMRDTCDDYPGSTEKHLEEADSIVSPMLMHLAEKDEYISKEAQRDIRGALESRSTVQVYSYPGCNHAFARHRGIHYDAAAAAAALANGRTSEFLKKHLR